MADDGRREPDPRDAASARDDGDRRCTLCGRREPAEHLLRVANVRLEVADWIAKRKPGRWPGTGFVGATCLTNARLGYEMDRLEEDRGVLSAVEEEVARHASEHEAIARDVTREFDEQTTGAQRAADRLATIGGSWAFIGAFGAVLVVWIVVNGVWLSGRAFDPYPFILLNLGLSCLAAIQAPVILMSQNRQTARDRLQADTDFRVNLKAEIEINSLHEKLDHLLHVQWDRMVELQQLQLDMLRTLVDTREGRMDDGDE
jgi:uncharacterized membrane protein